MQFVDPKGSFVKNLVLSVLLLGLSSFLIPIVLKQIDDQKAVDQQRFQDAALASRQDPRRAGRAARHHGVGLLGLRAVRLRCGDFTR